MAKSFLYTRIENDFAYHAPTGHKVGRHEGVRDECKNLASYLLAVCPESRELSLALTSLEETMMWANAAIARNPEENDG